MFAYNKIYIVQEGSKPGRSIKVTILLITAIRQERQFLPCNKQSHMDKNPGQVFQHKNNQADRRH